jgi:hypothetical protein
MRFLGCRLNDADHVAAKQASCTRCLFEYHELHGVVSFNQRATALLTITWLLA